MQHSSVALSQGRRARQRSTAQFSSRGGREAVDSGSRRATWTARLSHMQPSAHDPTLRSGGWFRVARPRDNETSRQKLR
eukprot:314360-Prymnesium_polylepis.1